MKSLTKEELKEMMHNKEDFVLINVLPKEYFDKEHIPGSINIPISDKGFEKKVIKKIPNKQKKIVVYCANFECSASPAAAEKLIEAGYKNVYDYEGGAKEYCKSFKCETVKATA